MLEMSSFSYFGHLGVGSDRKVLFDGCNSDLRVGCCVTIWTSSVNSLYEQSMGASSAW